MKTLLAIIMFAAIGCYATETNSLTSRIDEYKDKDGRLVGTCEQFYRGKDMVMMTFSLQNSQGQLAVRSRTYFVHGDRMMCELAVRKDDKLDTVTIWRPGTDDMEVYRRKSDGSVTPASTELVQAFANEDTTMRKLGVDGLKDPKNRSVIEDCGDKIEEALKSSNEKK